MMKAARVLIVSGLALFAGGRAAAEDDAKAIIQRAIQAQGGADLINKYPAAKIKAKGCMCAANMKLPFTAMFSYEWPDKVRQVQSYEFPQPQVPKGVPILPIAASLGRCKKVLQIGDKVRMFVDDQEVTPVGPDELESAKHALYIQTVSRLLPILDDKVFKLSTVEDCKVCDRPARCVRVTSEGRREVILCFDKGTGMLVKTEYKGRDALGQSAPYEEIYTNFKDVKGLMYPSRTQINVRGQRHAEYEVVEYLPLDKFDASEFTTP